MVKRATKAKVKQRTNQVAKMLMSGVNRADIVQFVSKEWGLDERTGDDYISRAKEAILESLDDKRDLHLAMALRRLSDLYTKTLRVDDYKGALSVQKEINKLIGLYAPERREYTGADGKDLVFKLVYPDDDN